MPSTIEELAFKHLSKHPNDKSGATLARMRRVYGRPAARIALENAREILRMTDPEHPALTRAAIRRDLNP